jgi:hygromycin-B 7''-O-kinase
MDSGEVATLVPDGSVVTEIVPRAGGALSSVWEVRLADAAPIVVKHYADRWRWKQAKEVHVYSLLAGVPGLPSVVHVDSERAVTVLTLVEGTPLSATPLSPAAQRDVFVQVGVLARAIHAIRMPAFGYVTSTVVDPEPDNAAYMTRQFDRKLAEFTALDGRADTARRIRAHLRGRTAAFARCDDARLCHNDLHAGNVLVLPDGDRWRVTGVVDVENATAADPLMDLAKTMQYENTRRDDVLEGLLDGYGPLPDDAAERLQLYRLYHALELWDWFASIGNTGPLDSIEDDILRLVR